MTIKVDLKIFVCIAIYIVFNNHLIYLLMILFGIIHEMGHLLMGVFLGLKPKSITIVPTGICLEFKYQYVFLIKVKEIIVSIAGPLVNLFFVLLCLFFPDYEQIIYINLLMFIFNLIPIYPLDGGRILKAILHMKYGYKKSIVLTNIISNINTGIIFLFGIILIIFAKIYSFVIVLVYLLIVRIQFLKQIKMKKISIE